jgi:hypothetical protein
MSAFIGLSPVERGPPIPVVRWWARGMRAVPGWGDATANVQNERRVVYSERAGRAA